MGIGISSLSALLAGIVTLAIGASVLLRDFKQPAHRRFAVLSFTISAWHLLQFAYAVVPGPATYWLSMLPGVAVPLAAQRFFVSFLAADPLRPPPVPRLFTLGTVALYGLLGYSAVVHPIHRSWIFGATLVAFVFAGLYGCAYYVYRRSRRAATHTEQMRLRYLLIGGLLAITFVLTDQLTRIGVQVPALGNLATIVYMYFLSQTLFRSRLLDLNELLGKMVVLSALMLILSILYGLLVFGVAAEERSSVRMLNTIIASFVILILFDPLRSLVEERVSRWMFREKFELRRLTDQLRRELSSIIDIGAMVRRVLAHLEESQRVTHAAIYLMDADGTGYELAGHLGPRPEERLDAVTRRPLLERLRRDGVLLLETLQRQQRPGEEAAAEAQEVMRTLEEMNAGMCLPLQADEHLLGMLCLRDERLREAYSTEEIDFFRSLAAQMSVTLQNGQAYEQMKERARLAALGEMAAGLAHEIRNPLGAIKGAAQYLRPTPPPGDGSRQGVDEFLDIIVEEVNRLNRVVSQFLDYARPDRGERETLDVNDVLRRTLQLLEPQAGKVSVEVRLAEDLPQIRASAEQLRQVFLNLGLNAVQSMPDGGKLYVSTRLRRGARRGEPASFLEVRFRDSGPGIPEKVQRNIFVPFFTTKEGGSGLGLAISQRIAQSHGGLIEVHSREGHGATFTVLLPLSDEASRTLQPAKEAAAK
jgi:two-component system, NtrC family, sensor histidine kinase HydH